MTTLVKKMKSNSNSLMIHTCALHLINSNMRDIPAVSVYLNNVRNNTWSLLSIGAITVKFQQIYIHLFTIDIS